MSSDHCGKEKKDFKLMGNKKTAAIEQVLGEKRIHDDSVDELMPHFVHANQINSASGGRRKLALILPFRTHLIHDFNLTVWHRQH